LTLANEQMPERALPFLQWAGGKRQLLQKLSHIITHKSLTYYEPFLGGGAVFYHFADKRRFQKAVLNDVNEELINCYEVVKDRLTELIQRLDAYREDSDWDKEPYFKQVRASKPSDPVEQAARTVYLNRTCFNSLYRLNSKGEFNTSFGKNPNPQLYNLANITACSETLKRYATLRIGDYADAVKDAQAGDLVYFDPPYVPVSETASFTSYTGPDQFGLDEQRTLASLFRELFDRGVIVILSNSDTPLVRELYEGFDRHIVGAKRIINSKADRRGEVNELVIVGQPEELKVDVSADLPDAFPLTCADCGTLYSSAEIVCIKCGSTNIED